jgi:hypothetical protein
MSNEDPILEKLERILLSYAEEHQVSVERCNLKLHASGVITIRVNDQDVEYFFSKREFLEWVVNQ